MGTAVVTDAFRTCGLWLIACALAVRLVIAPGFMPVASADGFTIAMCSGQSMTGVKFGKTDPAMPGDRGCAFASLAVATSPDVPTAVLPMVRPVAVAPVVAPVIRSPYVGVPAPPPPAIGPPALI